MKYLTKLIAATLPVLVASLCVTQVFAQSTPQELDRMLIEAVINDDADAMAELYADDAILYPAGSMVLRGRQAIRDDWAALFKVVDVTDFVIDNTDDEIGDTNIFHGTYVMKFVPRSGGDEVVGKGRYVGVSKKINGKWYYTLDHISAPAS